MASFNREELFTATEEAETPCGFLLPVSSLQKEARIAVFCIILSGFMELEEVRILL